MKKSALVHPLLFALYPILFLYAHNRHFVAMSETVAPAIISVVCALALCLAVVAVTKNWEKSALLVTLFVIMFFSFGHVFYTLERFIYFKFTTFKIGKNTFLALWVLSFIILAAVILATRRNLKGLTKGLSIAAAALVAMGLFQIASYEARASSSGAKVKESAQNPARALRAAPGAQSGELPDIYYIILDSYGRADMLKELYGFDNGEFMKYLTDKGFYIADKATSNYSFTVTSLASSLNMEHIRTLMGDRVEVTNLRPLRQLMYDNRVMRLLKERGYKIVSMTQNPREIGLADRVMGFGWLNLNDFQNLAIEMTPIPVLLKKVDRYGAYRRRVLYILDHLADIPRLNAPTFVFAHIMIPHPPFIFGPDGEDRPPKGRMEILDGRNFDGTKEEYKQLYLDQLVFTTKKIKIALDKIMAGLDKPTIIILQGDHGPRSFMVNEQNAKSVDFRECLSVLSAFYMPGDGAKNLYRTITPVNTFRVLFNTYFDAKYDLLKDDCFFSTVFEPLKLVNVTEKVSENGKDRPNRASPK